MKTLAVVTACLCGVVSIACSFEPVTFAEKRQLQQLRAGSHEVVPAGTRVGRFQHFDSGERTWRFDTDTGAICILLTSDLDWENAKTKSSACFVQPGTTPTPTGRFNPATGKVEPTANPFRKP